MLESRSLFLTGYRACGKTTVARALAERIDESWIDMDAEIVKTAKQTIAEIFADGGEESFRDLETDALARVAKQPPQIVSLGGGAVLRETNREIIRGSGQCVWLSASVSTIIQRLREDETTETQRPQLTDLPMEDEVERVLVSRTPIYESVADLRIDTGDLNVEEIVEQIVEFLA